MGREEFVAIIHTDDLNQLKEVAERIRQLCENSSYSYQDLNIKVTISIGGTLFKKDDNINDLTHRADQLMYKAKNTGRNKSVIQ